MATKLPESIGLDAPHGARPSMDVVAPTDFGLGKAAEALGSYAATKKAVDDRLDEREASKLITSVRQGYEPEMARRAELYDGQQPGYARTELDQLETSARATLDAEGRVGVRQAAYRQLDAYKAEVGDHVLKIESTKRAEPARLEAQGREELELSGGMATYITGLSKRQAERRQNGDPTMHGWAAGSLQDHDAAAAEAIAAAPEDQRPRLTAKLAAERTRVMANATDVEEKGRLAYVVDRFKTTTTTYANGVQTEPSTYDAAAAQVDIASTALPSAHRAAAAREAKGQLAYARIMGLLQDDDTTTAKAELDSGRFDAVLEPTQKEQLTARIEAVKASGPKTVAEWLKAEDLERRVAADVTARATTGRSSGQYTLQEITDTFGPHAAASTLAKLADADRQFAATGSVRDMDSTSLRQRAMATPPDPSEPDYARKREAWELITKAARDELTERDKDPAAWSMRSTRPGDAPSVVDGYWQAFTGAGTVQARGAAAERYAAAQLGLQERAGVPMGALRILPKDTAGRMVDTYAKAPPEQREAALREITGVVMAMPNVRLQSGQLVSGKQLVLRELDAAGLTRPDLSAIADLSDEPARLGQYVAASNNPQAKAALPGKGEDSQLQAAIDARLRLFMDTANALPGSAQLNAARRDRTIMVARHLVTAQGLSPKEAAKAATADLVDNYRFVDGYRIPRSAEVSTVRRGAAMALIDVTGSQDPIARATGRAITPNLLSADPGEHGAEKAAAAVRDNGRWITKEGDDGLLLAIPTTNGWTPVLDRYGRPVSLTWHQLEDRAKGKAPTWFAPPPAVAPGAAAKAPAKKTADALAQAVEHHESRGRTAAVSDEGALGVMQLMPDTAKRAAARLGIAYDEARLTTDPDYNRRLGRDELAFLSRRYDGNVALVAAAYNAGPGRLEGYTDKKTGRHVEGWLKTIGDPRRGHITVDEWVAQIPFKETRGYVANVLPTAMGFLK